MVLASVLSMPEAAPLGVDAALIDIKGTHCADGMPGGKGTAPEQSTQAR